MFHHVCRWEWRARQQTSRASVASPATEAAGSGGWCSSQRGRPGQPPHPDSQGPSQPLQAVCWVAALHLSISAASAQSRSATSPRQHEGPCATSISCLQWQPYTWAFKVRLLRAGQPFHPDNPKTLTLSQSCLPMAALHLSNLAASDQLRDGCKGPRVRPLCDDSPEIFMWDVTPYDEFKETRTRVRPLPVEAYPWWLSWNF